MDSLIDLLLGYKKVKLFYYLKSNLNLTKPIWLRDWYKHYLLKKHSNPEVKKYIFDRVSYYNKLDINQNLEKNSLEINNLSRKVSGSSYYYDTIEYLNYFNSKFKINVLFGDITHTPDNPTIAKSRPVENNTNSVILKLNKKRHFHFITDRIPFSKKKNKMIGVGMVNDQKALRVRFLETHFNNPLCDVGHTNDFRNNTWKINFIPIYQQLQYKFILCWEGNDVATNLKYVMSSNSLAVSTKPKYETWFMEGKLIGGVHYVEIKDDFSDLDEKLTYYATHIEAAEEIIKNANAYTKQFQDKKREDYISIKVLEKYFQKTNQLPE